MGVTTTADEKRREASAISEILSDNLNELIEKLELMIDPDTWGGNEWNSEFLNEIEDGIDDLMELRKKIRKLKRRL